MAGADLDAHCHAQARRVARDHSEQGLGADVYRFAQRKSHLIRVEISLTQTMLNVRPIRSTLAVPLEIGEREC